MQHADHHAHVQSMSSWHCSDAVTAYAPQVHRYLEAYVSSAGGSLPAADLMSCNALFAAASAGGLNATERVHRYESVGSRLTRYLGAPSNLLSATRVPLHV